jgi:hypothetical protein
LDKDATPAQIEAHWAQRVIWARKNVVPTTLGDINWAREVINDPDRRVRADVTSLNPDVSEGVLGRLIKEFGLATDSGPAWQPLTTDCRPEHYTPAAELPEASVVRAAIVLPEAPADLPAVVPIMEQWLREPLDPWTIELPAESTQDATS